jgi:nucleotide-binding universal stress UspA family protein
MSILICYDGSASAKHALEVARKVLDGGHVILLNVWIPPYRMLPDAFSTNENADAQAYEHLEKSIKERAREILTEGQALAERLGMVVTPRAECDQTGVAQTILQVADELDCDLIVTGTHGHTAVPSGLLGSVSSALVHLARRPVLVVPDNGGAADSRWATVAKVGAMRSG